MRRGEERRGEERTGEREREREVGKTNRNITETPHPPKKEKREAKKRGKQKEM